MSENGFELDPKISEQINEVGKVHEDRMREADGSINAYISQVDSEFDLTLREGEQHQAESRLFLDDVKKIEDYLVNEIHPEDLVITDTEIHPAVLPIGGRKLLLTYGQEITDEQLLNIINDLNMGGFPNLRIYLIGEGKESIEQNAKAENVLVLKNAPVKFISKIKKIDTESF